MSDRPIPVCLTCRMPMVPDTKMPADQGWWVPQCACPSVIHNRVDYGEGQQRRDVQAKKEMTDEQWAEGMRELGKTLPPTEAEVIAGLREELVAARDHIGCLQRDLDGAAAATAVVIRARDEARAHTDRTAQKNESLFKRFCAVAAQRDNLAKAAREVVAGCCVENEWRWPLEAVQRLTNVLSTLPPTP